MDREGMILRVVLILLVMLFGLLYALSTYAQNNEGSQSVITIHNTFNVNIKVRLKCNWDGKKWRIDKTQKLNGRDKIIERIPNNSNCQIWPHR